MAVESRRGCGYRKVGGLYLCGGGIPFFCDRLPLAIEPCPICGEEPRFSRGIAQIGPDCLWNPHQAYVDCRDPSTCPVCYPPGRGFLMWVGEEYTPASFTDEARRMGVSKRIANLPTDLRIGEDWVFLAYQKLIRNERYRYGPQAGWRPGIFHAFIPVTVELIITVTQSKDEAFMEELRQKGVHPVVVPDDDPDHARKKRKEAE